MENIYGKEIYTPQDFETAEDFIFSIKEDESEIEDVALKVKDIVINNEQVETYIKLVKKDLKTDKQVTLNSTTFFIKATKDIYDRATGKILYKKGERITQKIGGKTFYSFTTNADNVVIPDDSYFNRYDNKATTITPLKLEVGSYAIYELLLPTGFLELENPIEFKVEGIKNYDKDDDGDYIKEIVIKNEQPTGTLILDKSIALRNDIDTSLVDTTDLSKIKFKLTAKENIIDFADGSIIYKKGQEVGTYNLSEDGKLQVEDIPMGRYELQEIETLETLILNNKIYDVDFVKEDDTTKVYTVELNITNDTTLTEISKTDITGEKELVGASLKVVDLENDSIVDEWISTEKSHKIEGLIIGKHYKLLELTAPEPFVKATEIEFTINETGVEKVTMVDKLVTMSKVDIAGEEIIGAKMQVLDKNKENIIDEWESTKEPHKISNLVEGETYILHEEVVVDNFVKATDIEFLVTADKETQHITMIDKLVQVSKTDFVTGEEIEGAELKVVDSEDNIIDEWVSTKEPHFIKGLEENKTYKLIEITSPYGFEIAEEIEFTITQDKETQKIEMKDMPILTDIKLIKIDSETKEKIKDDFIFGIYEDQECTKLIQEIKADKENAVVIFEKLRYNTFYIKEIQAPENYALSDRIVKLEINDKGVFIDDVQIEKIDDEYSFEFENQKIEVPKTADERNITLWTILLSISIIGILIVLIYRYIKNKKNRK